MSVEYTRINWEDSPSTQTPLNAENLNAMDSAIDDLAGAVNDLDGVTDDIDDLESKVGAIKNDLSDGTFIVNNAENAEQLTSTVGIEDTTPYLFRTSGGSVDIGDREEVKKIVGGTIVNNQLVGAYGVMNVTQTIADGVVTITPENDRNRYRADKDLNTNGIYVTNNHVYLMSVVIKSDGEHEVGFQNFANPGVLNAFDKTASSAWTTLSVINKCTNSGIGYIQLASLQVSEYAVKENSFIVRDLTQAFGTAIADYVYSLETATAGAGVAWLKKNFPKQFNAGYQAYDAGSMQSVSGLTEHKMVGFNQFDEETYFTEKGFVKQSDGSWYLASLSNMAGVVIWENKAGYSGNMSFNYEYKNINSSGSGGLRVKTIFTDGTAYIDYPSVTTTMTKRTVTVNSNGKLVDRMVWDYGSGGQGTYLKDFCINFSWDGEKDGQYEPYKEYVYPLDSSLTLRGIPKVDANGNLYYDGDEYLPDGTVNRRYGVVDLGTLNWTYINIEDHKRFVAPFSSKPASKNLICAKYQNVGYSAVFNNTAEGISIHTDGDQIAVYDTAYTDAADFKTAMSGVYLLYEKATAETETADPYQETQIVDDFGTEEYVLADGAFPVPVGHVTMYQNNLRAKLEMSPDSPDGDGLYVVQQESGENTYVPLASTATIQDILTRLTALENA